LSELGNQYSNNVLDATMGWTKLVTDEAELAGMPESALAAAKAQAEAKELEGYLLTLDIPSYLPVMTYCDNQALREEMYRAYSTRASDQGPNAGKWDIQRQQVAFQLFRFGLGFCRSQRAFRHPRQLRFVGNEFGPAHRRIEDVVAVLVAQLGKT
ncbi:hypothetical protein ACUOA8_36055, partial [Escherichia sp. SS-MK2]